MTAVVEDTFSEVFGTKCTRFLVTAQNERWARIAAQEAVGFATSIIFCPAEAGIDGFVPSGPDGRPGYTVMITHPSKKMLKEQLLERIGQCVLTAPTTACFNMIESEEPFPIGKMMNYFGDGYGQEVKRWGRTLYSIPIMGGDFLIEKNFEYTKGFSGNLWIMLSDQEKGLGACEAVIEAIGKIEGVVAPFPGGICSSGSKIGSQKYSFLKASTNHEHCLLPSASFRHLIGDGAIEPAQVLWLILGSTRLWHRGLGHLEGYPCAAIDAGSRIGFYGAFIGLVWSTAAIAHGDDLQGGEGDCRHECSSLA